MYLYLDSTKRANNSESNNFIIDFNTTINIKKYLKLI